MKKCIPIAMSVCGLGWVLFQNRYGEPKRGRVNPRTVASIRPSVSNVMLLKPAMEGREREREGDLYDLVWKVYCVLFSVQFAFLID